MKFNGEQIYVKILEEDDAEGKWKLELRNRAFFQQFTILREESFYTLEGQMEVIKKHTDMKNQDQFYSFGIYLVVTGELIGIIQLTGIERGPQQSCWIGYYLDQNYNGNGYTTEAIDIMVSFAFNQLDLHRIEAGVMPHNLGSIRVLEKAGFQKEGIARKNVKINGHWQDHQILAIINEIH